MQLEVQLGHIITVGMAVIAAIWGGGLFLVKVIARQQEASLKEKFSLLNVSIKSMGDELTKEKEATQRLERQLLEFKAELPRDYVRREDYVREYGTLHVKLDNLRLEIQNFMMSNHTK